MYISFLFLAVPCILAQVALQRDMAEEHSRKRTCKGSSNNRMLKNRKGVMGNLLGKLRGLKTSEGQQKIIVVREKDCWCFCLLK